MSQLITDKTSLMMTNINYSYDFQHPNQDATLDFSTKSCDRAYDFSRKSSHRDVGTSFHLFRIKIRNASEWTPTHGPWSMD